MSGENKDTEKAKTKVPDIKFWQYSYAMLASIATGGAIIFAVINYFNSSNETKAEKQEIVIKHEYERPSIDKGEQKQVTYPQINNNESSPLSSSNEQKKYTPTPSKINTQEIIENNNQATIVTPSKKTISIAEEEDVFGIVKNNSKTKKQTAPEQEKQYFAKAVVIGESKAETGETIKIKLSQDLEGENFLIAHTSISGTIKVLNNRIQAEFKDKQGNKYYLCDKNGILGLDIAEKIPDSFQIKITNQNK